MSPVHQERTHENTITPDPAATSVILADLLIPGRGEPIPHAALAFRDGKITWIGDWANVPDGYGLNRFHVPVLMPGLWDSHCHYMGLEVAVNFSSSGSYYLPGANALIGALTAADLKETLRAGYTSIRECGGYAGDVKPAVEQGVLPGPNIYSSHAALSITGGHGDDHEYPITTVEEAMCHGGAPLAVCDGVPECIKTVRMMIRRGASVIKVCSSGGVLSLNDDPEDQQFSPEELKAIVDEAARSRRSVAAHAIGKAGIKNALEAGVHSIEHGMFLDDEIADLMKEKGAYFIATQHIVRTLASDYLDTLPPKMRRKVLALMERSKESYKLAVAHGVNIALGTDIGSSDRKSQLSHGNNAMELVYAVEAGMSPLQAIEAATASGPMTLGAMAPKSGQLKVGYDADFMGVKLNPLEDISVLTKRSNIQHVWKGGKYCRF